MGEGNRQVIYTGGTIVTVEPGQPRAEALLTRGDRIAAVGTVEEVRAAAAATGTAGPGDTPPAVVDLSGRALLPGFNDAHIHALNLGITESMIDLHDLSKREIIERLAEGADAIPPGEILMGIGWDYPACPDPHLRDLDRAFPERPVVLIQFSGHGGWVNTAALNRLRIRPGHDQWGLGGAQKDESGSYTGILRDPWSAPSLQFIYLKRMIRRSEIRTALEKAFSRLVRHGITTVQDNTWIPWVVREIARCHKAGIQTTRFSCWSLGSVPIVDRWMTLKRFDPDWYALGPVKYFWDGAFSSRTAWLHEPYVPANDGTAAAVGHGEDADHIARRLVRAIRRGRQVAAHAIGDAAVTAYVDGYGRALRKIGTSQDEHRFRIEHGQLIRQDDLPRIKALGMVVSAQPNAAADPEKDLALIGAERLLHAYPYRSILDAGIPLAFGSDYPGEATYDPMFGIHLAVNRDGPERISVDEAIAAYTAGSAYAEFAEARKGRLLPGYLADMAILSADPASVSSERIREIGVEATIVGGRTVWSSDE